LSSLAFCSCSSLQVDSLCTTACGGTGTRVRQVAAQVRRAARRQRRPLVAPPALDLSELGVLLAQLLQLLVGREQLVLDCVELPALALELRAQLQNEGRALRAITGGGRSAIAGGTSGRTFSAPVSGPNLAIVRAFFSSVSPGSLGEQLWESSNCQLAVVQAALGDALSVQLKPRPTLAGARARLLFV
jgi:hypothetical protein